MISRFLIDHFRIEGALPVLFDVALKGALLVAIAAVAAYALRKRSAASRHAAWTAAVVGHLAIPALILVLPAWKLPLLPATPWIAAQAPAPSAKPALSQSGASPTTSIIANPSVAPDRNSVVTTPVPESKSGAAATPSVVITPVVPGTRPGAIAILAAIWFAGAIFVLLRLAVGTWRVNQLAREGSRVEDGVWLSLTQRLANRLGVTRPLTLLRGERLAVPVTWGIVYPAVLLPEDADQWTEERRRFVLVHEMAHVKRFDALTQLLAQVAVAVFWFDPLVWIAAHQMRVEREHACDDYVLRDGTTPSLYAGELLEMVRSIGTPTHDRAAPAFAALAMARRSEFEGRMLAILDPRLDRHTLQRRGTFMTAVVLAFLVLPLAALRPFQQPTSTAASDEFPSSFKITFKNGVAQATPSAPSPSSKPAIAATPAQGASKVRWTCEAYPIGTQLTGTSSHISEHTDSDPERLDFLVSEPGRCTEAALIGKALFSTDETRIAQLSPGGFMRLRERTASEDRSMTAVPTGDGSVSYTATLNGRAVPFDNVMVSWVGRVLPEVLREAGINVPERVARLRAQGGVPAVLEAIARIHSSGSKRLHYEELIKKGAPLSASDAERIAEQAGRDLTSSGDLSSVIQMLPRSAVQSPGARRAIAGALSRIQSSGDKASTLEVLAPNADPDLLIILARAAEDLPSSGDKANFLIAAAAEFLTPRNDALRNAFFHAAATVPSSGDLANVLIDALPYGHADPQVAALVVQTSNGIASSGDVANVLIDLASQRVLTRNNPRTTLAAINRTMTMASSGDRANVLISLADANLLSTSEIKDAFAKAAMALPSDGDRANVLAAAARQ